jgi:hypothetical protein
MNYARERERCSSDARHCKKAELNPLASSPKRSTNRGQELRLLIGYRPNPESSEVSDFSSTFVSGTFPSGVS